MTDLELKQLNEILRFTQDEIKAFGFNEIKSVFLSAVGDFICEADFINGRLIYSVVRRI